MTIKEIRDTIDNAIKYVWIHNIRRDCSDGILNCEATLQASIYHHLRKYLGNAFFRKSGVSLFCEYYYLLDGSAKYADLAFIKYDDSVGDSVLAIIELKYLGKYARQETFTADRDKVRNFLRQSSSADNNSYAYLCFIHEAGINGKHAHNYIGKKQTENWAKNRLTILYGNLKSAEDEGRDYGDIDWIFGIEHSNDLNKGEYLDFTWPKYKGKNIALDT
jgi:hypothetical protein